MRWLVDTLGGLVELVAQAVRSGFRVRGPYWRWRAETAFGTDTASRPPLRQRVHAILDFARWTYRMKRGR